MLDVLYGLRGVSAVKFSFIYIQCACRWKSENRMGMSDAGAII